MPGAKIICCIQAFDCEKTVEAAMASVLNQTHEDWLCFVLSNGNKNTPKTPNNSFDAIKNFALRDRRFIVVNKAKNDMKMYFRMLCHLADCFPRSWLCTLDADDEYEPDFFARGLALAEAHELDIVACGTQLIQKRQAGDREGTLLSRRQLEEDLIVREGELTSLFPTYKPFFNEMWGKLFHARLLRRKNYERYVREELDGRFLADTLLTIHCLERSRAIGILSGTSHKFFQYQLRPVTNATTQANAAVAKRREKLLARSHFSVYETYGTVLSFLRSRGTVDKALYEYTQAVLFGWFGDYYARTLLPIQDEAVVASLAARLVFHPKFDELMRYPGSGKYDNLRDYQQRIDFCKRLRHTLMAQKMVRNRRVLWRKDLPCTQATRRQLDRTIARLEETIRTLSELKEARHDAE